MSDTAILIRVKKLLALSRDGGATPEEAALAAAKAAELLAAHRLEMAAVEGVSVDPGAAIEEDWASYGRDQWVSWLAVAVGRVTRCKPIIQFRFLNGNGPRTKGYTFIGRRDDLSGATAMLAFLVREIKLQGAVYARRNPGHGRTLANSFAVGAADVIVRRLTERHQRTVRESPAYGALVVQDDHAVTDYMREQFPHLRNGRRANVRVRDYGALAAGRAAGDRMDLGDRRVGGTLALPG